MILETLRILKDALSSGGSAPLATHIAAVPRDGGDAAPTTPTVVDETRSAAAALGRSPNATGPALLVSFQSATDDDPKTMQRTGDVTVAVIFRYVDKDATAERAAQDALYVMRALRRALKNIPMPVTRNQVAMYSLQTADYVAIDQKTDDKSTVVGVRATFVVRDNLL